MTDIIETGALVEVATVEQATERAAQIRQGIVNYTETVALVGLAYAQGDWRALDYDSWDAYVESEFGEQRLRLAGDVRRQAIEALRFDGLSTRAIGAVLGVSHQTVQRELPSTGPSGPVAPITGVNGKTYAPAQPAPRLPTEPVRKLIDRPNIPFTGASKAPATEPAPTSAPIRPRSEPSSAPADVDEDSARRSSNGFSSNLAGLWMVLDPDPIAFISTRYRPDAYQFGDLPRVRDAFTVAGLRALSRHLDAIADHLDATGEHL